MLWSLTGILLELPSGVLADLCSRRALVAAAPLLNGTGFALWTLAPGYPAFAAGFVLWGVGSAMRSGALEALVYAELVHIANQPRGAPDGAAPAPAPAGPLSGRSAGAEPAAAWVTRTYTRLIGRSRTAGIVAVMAATALSGPVLAAGGYAAAGAASVLATLAGALVGRALPAGAERERAAQRGCGRGRSRRPGRARRTGRVREAGLSLRSAAAEAVGVLRGGLGEVRASRPARGALLLLTVLMGTADSMDEYLPLLARSTGLSTPAVPPALLAVSAGAAAGGWFAGRYTHRTGAALVAAACCMAAGAAMGHPAGLALLAVTFGVTEWAKAAAEARLQDGVGEDARATVSSFAGFGAETAAVLTFAAYGLGSQWLGPGMLFVLAALPYTAAARAVRRG
ncbi:MFS transporter [Streptomonospora sediminis]